MKKTALCEIEWVIKLQLPTKKVNHVDKIIDIAIASGSPFSQLNFTIDAFKNTISNVRLNKMNNPRPMCANRIGKLHKCWSFGSFSIRHVLYGQ